ncbi:MAG: LysM peptidoglycan-binding domain-containing protein, partial [Bacteroidales bacterium]|nr:LysM peptidoglycan-binding domain-containing protein [Bacteroidales bacterium]
EITAANPGIDIHSLQIGQQLNIPFKKFTGESLVVLAKEKDTIIVHIVKKDETIYSISVQHKVSIDSIIEWNPILMDEPLKKGQKIIIKKRIKSPHRIVEGRTTQYDTILHQIKEKETLWSLARRYKVTVDEILSLNPELKDGLKEGYYIYVPVPKVKEAEAVASPGKGCEFSRYRNKYKIALMLPLYLDQVDRIWISPDDNLSSKPFFKSFSFVEFYEGVLIAIDSLKKTGLTVDLYVYDTQNDSNAVKNILRKPEMPYMDLIIGPFFEHNFGIAVKYAHQYNIKIVSPFARNTAMINRYNNFFQIQPSSGSRIKQIAEYVAQTYTNPSIILVTDNHDDDTQITAIFKEQLEMMAELQGQKIQLFQVNYSESGYTGVAKMLDAQKTNVVINLITGEAKVSNYVNNMSKMLKTFDIVMFAHPEWRDYATFDLQNLMDLQLHIYTTTFVDYSQPAVKWFLKEFRERFKTDPHSNNYAFLGYDITFFFLKALYENGLDFENCLEKLETQPTSTLFKFEQKDGKGFENIFINIYKYNEYELTLLNR